MFIIKRNQIIVTALVIMIAIAGYLNFIDSGNESQNLATATYSSADYDSAVVPNEDGLEVVIPNIGSSDTAANIDDSSTTMESSDTVLSAGEEDLDIFGDDYNSISTGDTTNQSNNSDPGSAIFVNSSSDTTYFVNAKLEREQARAKQKDILTEMINNKNLDKDQVAEFAQSMLSIQERIEKETSSEAMIEAKGFSEVYVRIGDGTVDVVVNKEALSEAELAQIEDIVTRKTGISIDKIKISPLKK